MYISVQVPKCDLEGRSLLGESRQNLARPVNQFSMQRHAGQAIISCQGSAQVTVGRTSKLYSRCIPGLRQLCM